jgi:GTP-binding protein EngB required for normal cell division
MTRMADREAVLDQALAELAGLGTDRDREQITAVRDRLAAARLRVLVAGEAKRGKSTLINALLGREVLPAGVTPVTAVATTVRYGAAPRAEVRFADGHDEEHPLGALPDLVTERGNPGNRRGLADVTVYLDAPVLAGGVELVDTPGTGSVFEWDTKAAHDALEAMDAAVLVLTADPPVSAAERDLLRRITGLSVRTFAVLNKADHLDETGLAEAAEFTRRVLDESAAGSAGGAGYPGRVYVMSARAALDGGDRGFAEFAAGFTAYLKDKRAADLAASAIAQARRIISSLLDEVALTRRAARMSAGQAAQRVEQFSARLAEVAVHAQDAVTIVNGESARLLVALNDAAGSDAPRFARDIARELDVLLDGELRADSAAGIEQRGRERLVALTLATASAWREQRRAAIEQGLAAVDARLAADLRTELGVLRESAAELLGLDLALPEPGGRLAEDRRFFFTTAEDTGQTELLAGAIRRSLPGELGRRRAREHLRRAVPGLVTAQIGRARADLQYRLAEATRALAQVVERRYADGTQRMRAALAAAAELRESSAADASRKEHELAAHEDALHRISGLLGTAAGPDNGYPGAGHGSAASPGAVPK